MAIVDDKTQYCLPFIENCLAAHRNRYPDADPARCPPFFLGVNGIQGAGKTTFVNALRSRLSSAPFNCNAVSFSLDDLYLTHAAQSALAAEHPSNPLLQHRGQPGTHDIPLANHIIRKLKATEPVKIPVYDKSAFDGEGDRADENTWTAVNDDADHIANVVIVEGWCLGFRQRPDEEIEREWRDAVRLRNEGGYHGRLGYMKLEDVLAINQALGAYAVFTDNLDALIHIDAADLHFVYDWREEQEAGLRALTGKGMTKEKVKAFVDGYYPSYELYTTNLRKGVFPKADSDTNEPRQLRLVVGKDRKVQNHYLI
ncbi:erg24, C-14 sterol reductase [Ascosphaera pollenicola]|nr:erg24, C-14 sterol reductase [Ascosphaera pollenicola]